MQFWSGVKLDISREISKLNNEVEINNLSLYRYNKETFYNFNIFFKNQFYPRIIECSD